MPSIIFLFCIGEALADLLLMLLGGLIMKLKLLLTSSFYLTGELSSDYGLIKVSSWQNTKSLNNGKIG